MTYPAIGHYARHWWAVPPAEGTQGYYFAMGFGGQYVIVMPDAGAVVVITSELYDHTSLPLRLFRKVLLPVLRPAA